MDRATAMMANLLDSLDLPPASRIAVQVEKSVEAMVLYLATLRAGHVFLPLNTAYQSGEIEYFIGNAEPAVVVCSPRNHRLGQQDRVQGRHAATSSPWATTAPAACSSAQRTTATAHARRAARRRPGRHLYTSGTTGRSKGAMLTHGNMLQQCS
jgi:malonyl-CoA/methylmalonyl-CoA synthetase